MVLIAHYMADTLKAQVLAAARALFMARGYEAVGMREIAEAVGKQPVQVYRLKLSKADILAELIIELNQEQIKQLPELRARMTGVTVFERTCSFLRELYVLDIHYLPIRSVGAAFGWMWSASHEQRVIEQVFQLVQPVVDAMQAAGLDDIPARCMGIWSLYYVGYRHAVMQNGTADECLAAIKPSLRFFLEPPLTLSEATHD
jgi:AcrR family transcriptional regulator